MSEMMTAKDKRDRLRALCERMKNEIMKALPANLDKERMFRTYLTAAQTENADPKRKSIFDCEPISVVGGIMRAAQFGLSLEGITGECYLIPRENFSQKKTYATFQLGYKGLRKLALRGDSELRDIYAQVVYENDFFEEKLGLEPSLVHTPMRNVNARGKIMCAYAVAVWKDDYRRFLVVDHDHIQRAMRSSGAKGDDPSPVWKDHEAPMWSKTAVRRLCDSLVLESDVSRGIGSDGTVQSQTVLTAPSSRALLIDAGFEPSELQEAEVAGALEEASDDALDQLAKEAERRAESAPVRRKPRQTRAAKEAAAAAAKENADNNAGDGDNAEENATTSEPEN